MLIRALALVALTALAACSRVVEAQDVETQHWSVDPAGDDGRFTIDVVTTDAKGPHRVRILVAADVDVSWRSGTVFMSRAKGATSEHEKEDGLFAEGRRIDVEERALLVGERSLGELPDGAEVDVRLDGVFVNGERLGDL